MKKLKTIDREIILENFVIPGLKKQEKSDEHIATFNTKSIANPDTVWNFSLAPTTKFIKRL